MVCERELRSQAGEMGSVIRMQSWRGAVLRFRVWVLWHFQGKISAVSGKYPSDVYGPLLYITVCACVYICFPLKGKYNGMGNKLPCFFSTRPLFQGLKNSILKPPAFADGFVCLANMSFWSALFFLRMAVPPHLGPRPALWS